MTRPLVLALAAALWVAAASAQSVEPGRRWALILTGDGAATRDPAARELATVLRQDFGYADENVLFLPGATVADFFSSLNRLRDRVRRSDSVFVLIAARTVSMTRGKTAGEQIVLAGGDEKAPWTLMAVSELMGQVRNIGAASTLLAVDECLHVESGWLSSPETASVKQNAAQSFRMNRLQVLTGCPSDRFIAGLSEALRRLPAGDDRRRVTPRDLAGQIRTAAPEVVTAAVGEGPFFFQRAVSASALIARLDRAGAKTDRVRAINELAQVTLTNRAADEVSRAHAALLLLARDRREDVDIRVAAVQAVSTITAPTAVRDLGVLLRDETDSAVLTAAISSLERVRSTPAVAELEAALDARPPEVRAEAIRALGRMQSATSLPRILRRLDVEKESEPLLAGLQVIPVLAARGATQSVTTVLDILRHRAPTPQIQAAAIGALGLLGSARAQPDLIERLGRGQTDAVRAAAAVALASIENTDGTLRDRTLIEALRDQAPSVRESAAFALGRLRVAAAVKLLMTLLATPQEAVEVRVAAARALSEINVRDARASLKDALADGSPLVRRAAAAALGNIGDPDDIAALRDLQERDKEVYVRNAAQLAIRKLSNAEEVLREDLVSRDPSLRREAVIMLGTRNTPAAIPLLVARIADSDAQVARQAIFELSRMTGPAVTDALMAELASTAAGRELSARRSGAAIALGARRDPRALDAIIARVRDGDPQVRTAVIGALGSFDDPRIMTVLEEAAASSDVSIRQAAADAFTAYGNTLYTNRPDDAVRAFLRASQVHSDLFGTSDPEVATDLNNLGVALMRLQRYDEAERRLQNALEMRDKTLGPNHPETATSLVNLGLLYANQKRFNNAEPLYLRGLSVRESSFGRDDASLAPLLDEIAKMYDEQGRKDEADRFRRRAKAILAVPAQKK